MNGVLGVLGGGGGSVDGVLDVLRGGSVDGVLGVVRGGVPVIAN